MAMDDTEPPGTRDPGSDSTEAGDGTFSIGPLQPVEDSRKLPAVSAEDEAGAVHGADLGDKHPDNVHIVDDDVAALEPDADAGEELPGDDELESLVADVDTDAVDEVGFDAADLEVPLDGPSPMGGL
jgi:hypothetical protein